VLSDIVPDALFLISPSIPSQSPAAAATAAAAAAAYYAFAATGRRHQAMLLGDAFV